LRLLAICEITDWVQAPDSVFSTATALSNRPAAIEEVQQLMQSDAAKTAILAALSDPSSETERSLERRSAIVLAGRLKLADASAQLLKSLHEKNDLEQVIEAIGALGDPKLAPDLVQLARHTVDVKDRTNRVLSPQPVAEDDEQSAKTYWRILRSLGNLPAPDAVQLLVAAVGDFAPDKREQALLSLIEIQSLQPSLVSHNQANQAIEKGLSDANASMRVAALIGAGKGQSLANLSPIIDALNSREMSVSRQSQEALSYLWKHDSAKVAAALAEKLEKESDSFRKQRISDLIASLKGQ
jgi:HEAT repeat protein